MVKLTAKFSFMEEYKLSDIAEVRTGPFGSQLHNEDYVSTGTPIVTVEHLGNRRFSKQNLPLVSDDDKKRLSKYLLQEGDIVFSRVGSVDRCSYVTSAENDWLFSGRCLRVRCGNNCHPLFLYYYFCKESVKQYIKSIAVGATMPSINTKLMAEIPILLPKLEEQRCIADILSSFDDKIELNRRINDNLEKMAKQLYDYWFVQFDFPNENGRPYKSSGGAMVWNEKLKREIPKEWDNCTLEYYLIIKNGRDHKHLGNGIYPVYGSGGEIRKVDSFIYSGESILMPRKGSLNNIMYVNDAFWSVDTMFYSEMKQPHCAKYVFYSIKDIDFTRWDSGTGVPSMTSSTLYSILLVKPDADSLAKFDEIITPLFLMIKKNEMQIVELTKQRDDLLPLLMNGQASVNYHLSDD